MRTYGEIKVMKLGMFSMKKFEARINKKIARKLRKDFYTNNKVRDIDNNDGSKEIWKTPSSMF